MSGYLPLGAFRQGLLPSACSSCAWWQTTGSGKLSSAAAADIHRRWIASLEDSWGSPGLLLYTNRETHGGVSHSAPADAVSTGLGPSGSDPSPVVVASVAFAPADMVPRLRDLPFGGFGSLSDGSVLLFCLTCGREEPRYQPKRVLHKALRHLRTRGVREVYAVATHRGETDGVAGLHGTFDRDHCRFFPLDFLVANGFHPIADNAGLVLTRLDLGGILAVIGQVQATVRRVLGSEPAPSPAAWIRRHAGPAG